MENIKLRKSSRKLEIFQSVRDDQSILLSCCGMLPDFFDFVHESQITMYCNNDLGCWLCRCVIAFDGISEVSHEPVVIFALCSNNFGCSLNYFQQFFELYFLDQYRS